MAEEGLTRKLAAIFYADVAGYSRLTGADEEGTHKTLSANLDAISNLIEGHGGRVLHYAGDAVLAEFASVVVAVNCAVEVQRDLAARNQSLADDRKVQFRIGVNLGDVIVDRDELYGDGVNVAARLESLAEPGGICVSRKVLGEVRDKLEVGYESLGEQSVKNIERPIPVYRVMLAPEAAGRIIGERPRVGAARVRRGLMAAAAVALLAVVGGVAVWWPRSPDVEPVSIERMAFPLPDKPSIAVLPFDNLSGDPGQAYFSDGITENIITTLSQVSNLFVIARNSTFVYKGKPVKVQQVAAELGVRFVLEGSVQKDGDKVRISAQLIDALSGNHLWAQHYDRELVDLFAVQDEITEHIVTALQIKLTAGEQIRVHRQHTRSLEAWNLLAEGVEHFYRRNKTDNARARQFFNDAIGADPDYALAYAVLAWTHWSDAQNGWSDHPELSFERAASLAEKARALDEELPDVYALQGAIYLYQGRHDAAVASGEKAVALNPNHANNTALLALFLHSAGRPTEGIRNLKRAMRLSPYYPAWYLEELGFAYLDANQPEDALAAMAKFLEREPSGTHATHARIGQALAYDALGRDDAAQAVVIEAVNADSAISITRFNRDSPISNSEAWESRLAVLRRLGLPD
ncbi:MAG: adenylate/guanylate cyclase domain-containing protein [Rhodospirillales bacterium]|nr:adenylate/guanylate cyclase domain-containing protein [Rhodospirillales bacterium]